MNKNTYVDADGFTVHQGHGELDLSFLDARLDPAHESAAFGISPEFFEAQRRHDADDFEGLVDAAQG